MHDHLCSSMDNSGGSLCSKLVIDRVRVWEEAISDLRWGYKVALLQYVI